MFYFEELERFEGKSRFRVVFKSFSVGLLVPRVVQSNLAEAFLGKRACQAQSLTAILHNGLHT